MYVACLALRMSYFAIVPNLVFDQNLDQQVSFLVATHIQNLIVSTPSNSYLRLYSNCKTNNIYLILLTGKGIVCPVHGWIDSDSKLQCISYLLGYSKIMERNERFKYNQHDCILRTL